MKLIIDNRETHLIEKLKNLLVEFEVKMLDIGDIVIENDDGTIALVAERKTVSDLSSSICDNRWREQKIRLLGTVDKPRILYIVEGDISTSTGIKGGTDTLIGSLINTMYRDDLRIFKTSSLNETALLVRKLFSKTDIINSAEDIEINYTSILKKKKKDNMTNTVIFHNTLTLIPRLSDGIAEVIVETYKSISKLIEAYTELDEDDRKDMLKNLEYKIKDDKIRKVGPVISERVYKCLFNIE